MRKCLAEMSAAVVCPRERLEAVQKIPGQFNTLTYKVCRRPFTNHSSLGFLVSQSYALQVLQC